MAITAEQRNDVISLLVGMFDAAPSAALMAGFVTSIEGGSSTTDIANELDDTTEFQSLYPTWMTDDEFATNFTTNILDGNTSSGELTDAIDAVKGLLAGGSTRGETVDIAVSYLMSVGTADPIYGDAVQALTNKVEVATYFATTQLDASSDFASLQAVLANVDETAASVTTQKTLIDADLDSATQNMTTGQDNLTGSGGNDGFTAWIFDNANSAQSGDMIDGGSGTDTLYAEIGNSQDFAIKLHTDSVEVAHFEVQAESTDSSDNDIQNGSDDGIDQGVQVDAQDMNGTVEFWSTDSRASLTVEDVRENSNTVTLGWRDTDAGSVNFETYFDTQHITAPSAVTADSQLFLELLDLEGMATDGDPLLNNPYVGVSFTVDGVTFQAAGDTAVTSSYSDLVDALNFALDAQGLTTITASLGSAFTAINSDDGLSYGGTTIVLTNTGPEELGTGGWIADGILPADSNLHTTQSTTPPATSTELTQVDVIFDNVGRGSMSHDFVAGNISQGAYSGSQGIQQFNIDIDRDSWVNEVRSTNNTLEEVFLESIGSEGEARIDVLNDVRVFDATAMTNDVTLSATLDETVIAKYFDLEDTATDETTDNISFEYDTASGDDTVNLTVSQEAASYEDFALAITTSSGADTVRLEVNNLDSDLDTAWVADQEALDNITITTGSGNDTVTTFGGGSATINTGSGDDTVYSDNSGIDNQAATWLFNAANIDLGDIQGQGVGTAQVLIGAQLTVTFSSGSTGAGVDAADAVALTTGFESTVTIGTDANGFGDEASINQAIKNAINNDATLSELLLAEDGPNHSLVVTSLVDGVFGAQDLDVAIVARDVDEVGNVMSTADKTIAQNANRDFLNTSAAADLSDVNLQTALDGFVTTIQGAGTGYNGTLVQAEGSATVATGTITTATAQTIDVSALSLVATDTIDFVIDGTTVTYTAGGVLTGDALEAAITTALGATTVIDGIVYTVTNPTAGAGDLTFTQGAAKTIAAITAAADVALVGVASDEEANDNVINAGTGSDTVVLSTHGTSNETIVFTGTNNGVVEVFNFEDGGTAWADMIDLSEYLSNQTSVSGSTASAVDVAHNVTIGTVAANTMAQANAVLVLTDFTATATDTWDGLTASVLLAAVNSTNVANANDYGDITENTLESIAAPANLLGTTNDYVVMIENEANKGEYKIFSLTSTDGSEPDFASADLVGTIDVGAQATFVAGNILS